MLISYVEKYGRSKQKITLADGDSFIISEKDWKAFGAEAGEDMDDGLIERLYREYLLPKAKLRTLNLLKVRDRSHKELISRLKQDGYPETVIRQAMVMWTAIIMWMIFGSQKIMLNIKGAGKAAGSLHTSCRRKELI